MNAIVVVDSNWGIGKGGKLLTNLPGDMKFFRETTSGKIVVMGRKTLESFPHGKPLKNRTNLVLTTEPREIEGAFVLHSIPDVLKQLERYPSEDVFLIGGQSIYEQFLPYCDRAYVTYMEREFPADTYFCRLDQDQAWKLEQVSEKQNQDGLNYEFRTYVRSAI